MTADERAAIDAMRSFLSQSGTLPEDHWQELARHLRHRCLERGAHLVRAGERPTTVAFVAEGLLRLYYGRADGREFNKSFVAAPDFASAHEALLTGEASRLAIQALEPTRLVVLDYAVLTSFYERDIVWQRMARLFVEGLYVKKARKEAALLMDSAAERYRTFTTECGHLEGRIADYHIASYLGITPEALSRLKPTVRGERPPPGRS